MYNYEKWVFEKKRLEEAISRLQSEVEYRKIELGDSTLDFCRGDRPRAESGPVYAALVIQLNDLKSRYEYLKVFGVLPEDGIADDQTN